ncbi:MAG: polymerase delta [Deferribacteraceae bacterium]|jgi:DNA polymerase-3 subunit delta|nr:polymerase delta [Deferribacteraceae bacterium]
MNSKTDKILIIGSDSFHDEQVEKVFERFADLEIDKKVYYGDEFDYEDFVFFISSLPLFSDLKVALVKKTEKLKKVEDILSTVSKSESVIIFLSGEEKAAADFKKCENIKIINEPKKNKYSDLNLISDMFSEIGIKLSKLAAEEIYEMCGKDFGIVKNEVEKLKIYYAYKKPEGENEILEKISYAKSENVFDFIDSFFDKNKHKCMKILEGMTKNNENLAPLFYMLSKRLMQIAVYKINPALINERQFIMEKIKKNAANWSILELSKCSDLFVKIDYGSKVGMADIDNDIITLLGLI